MNRSVSKTWMQDRKVARWWWAEVVREDVANDNEHMAEWANRWTKVAQDWEDRNWHAEARQVRSMVAVARQVNRVRSV